jgi:hypothetical protein
MKDYEFVVKGDKIWCNNPDSCKHKDLTSVEKLENTLEIK